jgi:hypothetical protein
MSISISFVSQRQFSQPSADVVGVVVTEMSAAVMANGLIGSSQILFVPQSHVQHVFLQNFLKFFTLKFYTSQNL